MEVSFTTSSVRHPHSQHRYPTNDLQPSDPNPHPDHESKVRPEGVEDSCSDAKDMCVGLSRELRNGSSAHCFPTGYPASAVKDSNGRCRNRNYSPEPDAPTDWRNRSPEYSSLLIVIFQLDDRFAGFRLAQIFFSRCVFLGFDFVLGLRCFFARVLVESYEV
ncbi:hypothetical protein L1987_59646 [Smallanthus sonchifolius]|uniref:Uncharacterized protein n=1 Tax=Smallanthus sonchifolius TaxID=185202 RepID=A0ACB9D5W5_9ASTR|nr:hypothetical protein L1987_59646 [Smallanthus sonchifolius]